MTMDERRTRLELLSRHSKTSEALGRALERELDRTERPTREEQAEQRWLSWNLRDEGTMELEEEMPSVLRRVREQVGERRVSDVIFHPERFLPGGVTFPLDLAEAGLLLAALFSQPDDRPSPWTLAEMTETLIASNPLYPFSRQPLNAYYAATILYAAEQLLFDRDGRLTSTFIPRMSGP